MNEIGVKCLEMEYYPMGILCCFTTFWFWFEKCPL